MHETARVTRLYYAQSTVARMQSRSCYESAGPVNADGLLNPLSYQGKARLLK
jgi:hypothetical protein